MWTPGWDVSANICLPQVRGEAQGKADDLERLKKDLNKGPRHAHVVRLDTEDIEIKDGETSFDA